ncbi:MAG: DUF4262 domain-containing protein [Sphingobium sp.]|nr:DUF4262 domain-containing protein [Sphingobium sp.]
MTEARPLNDYEIKLLENIQTSGFQITGVFDPEGANSPFCYSIGFTESIRQPEVIVVGLDGNLMGSMIRETFRQCRDEGLELADWAVADELLDGFPCVLRKVHPSWIVPDYFNSAMWFHRRYFGQELVAAMQIVWPCPQTALFPWDEDCPDDVVEAQLPMMLPRVAA